MEPAPAMAVVSIGVELRGPRLHFPPSYPTVDADAAGRFSVYPPKDKPYMLFVCHARGFAVIRSDEFERERTITVKPWGRIQGSVAAVPGFSQHVQLEMFGPKQSPWPLLWFFATSPDVEDPRTRSKPL